MTEINSTKSQSSQGDSIIEVVNLVVTQTVPLSQEDQEILVEETIVQMEETNDKGQDSAPTKPDETKKITIEESGADEPQITPPRKSARLSAKRRDSIAEAETVTRMKSESPIPRRRSMRLGSTSSLDTPSKAKDELISKKLPTISETDKGTANKDNETKVDGENTNGNNTLVDELAAAFVEEFID